ncbi:MAG TPA: polyprenyl synthetase family protein, partial [Acidimicrobiales bacterium]|nr:polyprenyl synthetase family protein [Acidimicrobiales bacterium]
MIPIRSVPEVLARARDLSSPALEHALGRLSPELRPLAEYHFGLADEHGRRVDGASTGKGVRAALVVLSAEAAGASAETGVPGAVAVELVHNFSLIHDDVIDCDRPRHAGLGRGARRLRRQHDEGRPHPLAGGGAVDPAAVLVGEAEVVLG